ncbi:uncharacterized protein LOC121727650 isoform X1 [Aricia agestis]|uniref:uncharacterized protein LOC121727650 isoform X1 n=1 Tax=Aricia agestis TaxID=91739 RepID=UPI001C203C8D|nr:uncharacterized protein LOC121727650 isoform X1 [Aricia agestis]XP_041971532.1 uncharacterized protein LOC121727650 isoform X1 [Aricia agestis]XP_041971533.1 uncharacterized protein LOC121727650 isoform X1 [Aricia agestis]
MPPLELEGCHLGEKHKSYNVLVKKTTKGERVVNLDGFKEDDDDITNLLKIDIASCQRNVEYILKVLVCNDMLYVSKVLKKCNWLLVEKEYEHIINPQNLHEALFPKMCTKASIKLIKCLQRQLKDANRVEQFYEYEENVVKAVNWLPHCSLNFIENNLPKHIEHIKPVMLRRLCERSVKNLQVYIDNCPADYMKTEALENTTFLIRTHTMEYLDIDAKVNDTRTPKLSPVTTKIIMKTCPNKIIDNFEKYGNRIHIPTFVKFIGKENVKEFLLKQALKASAPENNFYLRADNLKVLVDSIPIKERFTFIKNVFIDKEFKNETSAMSDSEKKALDYLHGCLIRFYREHMRYKYAPFDVAFNHLKKMIEDSSSDEDIKSILNVLITCASENVSEINDILQYVKTSRKIQFKSAIKNYFVKELLTRTNFKMFDCKLWDALQELTKKECSDSPEGCKILTLALIVYKVVNSERVPENMLNIFEFDTLKNFQEKFTSSEQKLIFEFLYEHILNKLKDKTCNNEDALKEWTVDAQHALQLLIDWDKDLKDYLVLLDEMKRIIKNNIESGNNFDLSFIYNKKKSWKKYFFHESLYLCQNDYTLMNSLKHDPSVLQDYVDKRPTAFVKIAPVRKFLRKIRVYYPTSIGKDWFVMYNQNISNVSEHKTISYAISILSSRADFEKTLKEYAPEISGPELWSLRCHLAKSMHFSRPQPSPRLLFPYTKGEYLKYALPSLFSIFYNINIEEFRKYIPRLLDSQVSLQKHGIRLAFARLPSCESSIIFEERWKSSKNLSIRCVLFKVVFELLSKEKNEDRAKDIWNLLNVIIADLNLKENDKIYDLLFDVEKLPPIIQAQYYMNVYDFLKKLSSSKDFLVKYNYRFCNGFVRYATTLIDRLSPEFVTRMLLELINAGFGESNQSYESSVLAVMASFCLSAKGDQKSESSKYADIFIPFHKYCTENNKKSTLSSFLDHLRENISNEFDKNSINIPLDLFVNIQRMLKESMPLTENYIMLTKWNLTVLFLSTIIKEIQEPASKWDEICSKVASQFGKLCGSMLKEHCTNHFPYIYVLFSKALKQFFNNFIEVSVVLDIVLNMLDESVESYLVAVKLAKYFSRLTSNDDIKTNNLKKKLSSHPSAEIKIHYYRAFTEFDDCFGEICGFDD